MPRFAKKLTAEFIGTFILVLAGTGAIILDPGNFGIALTFGLAVFSMIEVFGDISGAHINPAVTLGFVFAWRFSPRYAASYIGAQILGAISASMILKLLFPANEFLGATIPSGSDLQSFIIEIILSAILMLVILIVSAGAKEKGSRAAIMIGAVVALEAFFAGPITGASMNPARSLGPAIISGHSSALWIYILAPIIGALTAVPFCKLLHSNCCHGKCSPV